MAPRKKADCTPEEWASIRERARAYDKKERSKPSRRAYMRSYMAVYTKTAAYRARDNARYDVDRQQRQLASHRARTYEITQDEVAALRVWQGNACAVCGANFLPPRLGRRHGTDCLDHCHDTGKARGLLCRMCNTFEGFIRKKAMAPAEFAARLQAYLDNPPADAVRQALEMV